MGQTGLTGLKITWLDNITLRNVKGIGSRAGAAGAQFGGEFKYVQDLRIVDCDFRGFDDRSFWIWRCLNPIVTRSTMGDANRTGLSYGIQVAAGTFGARITKNSFIDCRHGVDFGDNTGVSRGAIVSHNVLSQMREHALSTHTASDGTIFDSNIIYCDPNVALGGGILDRGRSTKIINNEIFNPGNVGIEVFLNTNVGEDALNISGNNIENCKGTTGISVRKNFPGNDIGRVSVTNNFVHGDSGATGISVRADTASIDFVSVNGNAVSSFDDGILLQTTAAILINMATVCNNTLDTTGSEAIFVTAGAANSINDITVIGNTVQGTATFGYRGLNDDNVVIVGNNFKVATTPVATAATSFVNASNLV